MEYPADVKSGPSGASSPVGLPGPDRLARPARLGLAAAALLALAWIALHAAVDRPAVHQRIQARALELLRARVGPVELAQPVEIDWLFRAWLGPLRLPASSPAAEPLFTAERIRVRASLLAAMAGRLEAASVRLHGVRFAPGENGRELEAAMERWRTPRGPPGPPARASRASDPVVHLRDVTLALEWRGRTLEVGPFDAKLRRRGAGGGEEIEVDTWFPTGGHARLRMSRSGARGRAWAYRGDAELGAADLPMTARSGGLRAEAGRLSLRLTGVAEGDRIESTASWSLQRVRLGGERLGPEPIGPLEARGEAELAWNRAARRLELRRAHLEPLGPLVVEAQGALDLGAEPSFALSVLVPPVDYQALVQALPPALAPPRAAPRPPGRFGASLKLAGPLTPLVGWTVSAALDLAPMRAAAAAAPPSPLLGTFVARPDGDDGVAIRLGPPSPAFVPIAELPEHVVRAVTTAEDAGFHGHQGFDFAELLDALAAGAQAGRVVRGGSTISQQLAKNLYLSRDRTLARKAREALVTVALEASLPKSRLLEIYLNLIEWGPGVHGIGPAARHYFGVDARQLTPRQACFLAAIIPSPNRSNGLVAAGLGDRAYRDRVDDLLQRLGGFQVLTDEALAESLQEPLRFAFGAAAPQEASGDGG